MLNPKNGVDKNTVTIPTPAVMTLLIPTPLLFWTVYNSCITEFKPFGVSTISISRIADEYTLARKVPDL